MSETPDTPSTEARWTPPTEDREAINIHPEAKQALRRLLMDDPRFRGVGYSEFVMRAVRQEAADTSGAHDDLMRYFGEVSMGGPLHHGTEQWDRLSREVRRIVTSLARQEAADTSGLLDTMRVKDAVMRLPTHDHIFNDTPYIERLAVLDMLDTLHAAALRGATERPLDVLAAHHEPGVECAICARLASPTTEDPA